jgi:hypothetical protein
MIVKTLLIVTPVLLEQYTNGGTGLAESPMAAVCSIGREMGLLEPLPRIGDVLEVASEGQYAKRKPKNREPFRFRARQVLDRGDSVEVIAEGGQYYSFSELRVALKRMRDDGWRVEMMSGKGYMEDGGYGAQNTLFD